ncbi:Uncharacterised protein [Coprococcus eutactus]|jgi:hypothetical protein|nr:Uncharacterised protein [Coprococcus eutactus]
MYTPEQKQEAIDVYLQVGIVNAMQHITVSILPLNIKFF